MAGAPSGKKEKLRITACSVEKDGSLTIGSEEFEVLLNPSSFNHQRSISYDRPSTIGQVGSEVKFAGVGCEDVEFQILLDGTGVLGGEDVKTQMEALKAIVYDYDGVEHEPSVVRLLWGTFFFFGRLRSMSAEHTLFKPGGEPLRSRIELAFAAFMSKEEQSLTANRSSPDLSHIVEVRKGDTLPLLCYQIYKDSAYYTEVARFNGISAFRTLEPGTRVRFPPLTSAQDTAPPPNGVRRYPPTPSLPWRSRKRSGSGSA